MSNPLFNIQYGLFVITTCDGGRDNSCISNTIAQVAMQLDRIFVALNKSNLTKARPSGAVPSAVKSM